jgi:hypothetical protein
MPENDGLGALGSAARATQDEADAPFGMQKLSQRLVDPDPDLVASEVGDRSGVRLPLLPRQRFERNPIGDGGFFRELRHAVTCLQNLLF